MNARRIPTKRRRGKFDEERERTHAPTNRSDCEHLIEATGDSVEQTGCGCPGNKMTSVWECDLFGLVAPFAKGVPVGEVRACQTCPSYRKSIPPSPGADLPAPQSSQPTNSNEAEQR